MNYIKGNIIANDKDYVIVNTNSGIGYRIEIFGLDVNSDNFDFSNIELFIEETFNTQSGITTRYAVIDYDALKLLWFLKKNIKKIPMKILVSLVNKFNVNEITNIIATKNVKFLTSNISGLGKANAEKICNVEINKDMFNIDEKMIDDVNFIKKKISSLGRNINSDEVSKISKKLYDGENRDNIVKNFIKYNGIHD